MTASRRLSIADTAQVFKTTKTRRERTLELGPQRVEKAARAIRDIRQLGNPQNHDLHRDEAVRIVAKLKDELEALEYELMNPGKTAPAPGIFDAE